MNLPTKEQCMQMLKEQKVHEALMVHTLTVTNIAVFLAKELKNKGVNIDEELVEKAALLHDLDKLQCLGENCGKHGRIAHDILLEKGYSEKLAELVKYHILEKGDPEDYGWELKVLRYADARALGSDIVPVEKRLQNSFAKYPFLDKKEMTSKVEYIEKQICKKIGLNPEQIAERIR